MYIFGFLVGFLVLFLFLSAFPCCVAVCREKRPERMLLVSLLGNGLLLYVAAMFRQVNTGFYLLLILNMLWYIPVVIRLKQQPGLLKNYFTPPVIVFWVFSVFLLHWTLPHQFMHWDEYSHWGFAARMLFEREGMTCVFGKIMSHASYPPGLPLIQILMHKCFLFYPFRDGIVIAGNIIFVMLCTLSVFGDCKKRQGNFIGSICYAVSVYSLLLCLLLLLFSSSVLSSYSDPFLAFLLGLAVYRTFRAEQTWQDDLELMLLFSWVFLFKKSGIPTVVIAMLFYGIRLFLFRKERSGTISRITPLAVFAFPFLVQYSWSLLLKYYNTPIQFSAEKFTAEKLLGLFNGEPAYADEVLKLLLQEFFVNDYLLLGTFLCLAVICVLYICFGRNKPAAPQTVYIFIPVYFLLMTFFLYLTYLFIFDESQAMHLVSFQRYIITFLFVDLLLVLFLFLTDDTLTDKLFSLRAHKVILLIAACASVSLLSSNLTACRLVKLDGLDARRRRDLNDAIRKYDHILRAEGTRFMVFSTCGRGQKNFMFLYEYPDQFQWQTNLNPKISQEKVDKQGDGRVTSVEDVRAMIRDYTHILIDREDEDFFTDYSDIFEGKPVTDQFQVLYRVTPEGKLQYIPPREEK